MSPFLSPISPADADLARRLAWLDRLSTEADADGDHAVAAQLHAEAAELNRIIGKAAA